MSKIVIFFWRSTFFWQKNYKKNFANKKSKIKKNYEQHKCKLKKVMQFTFSFATVVVGILCYWCYYPYTFKFWVIPSIRDFFFALFSRKKQLLRKFLPKKETKETKVNIWQMKSYLLNIWSFKIVILSTFCQKIYCFIFVCFCAVGGGVRNFGVLWNEK